MAAGHHRPAKPAKSATDNAIGKGRASHQWFAPVLEAFAQKFPRKTALELALRSGRHVRVCEIWLSGKGAADGPALAALICSDQGDLVLDALTARCGHAWAENARATREISKLRKQQAEAADRLAALERGMR